MDASKRPAKRLQLLQPPPVPPPPTGAGRALERDPNTVMRPYAESRLLRAGTPPVGSRRRRIALRTRANLPFGLMPYQCFQEARKILKQDRDEKLLAIAADERRLAPLLAAGVQTDPVAESRRRNRILTVQRSLENLQIMADINDPEVKRRFENGMGDMNKVIYRHLGDKEWRAYRRKITMQRIEQFHIVPDLLPKLDPTADVQLFFGRTKTAPGAIVPSLTSERPPRLRVQVFDPGERLVTVAVVNLDVPVLETNSFISRLHYLAVNVRLAPDRRSIPLASPQPGDRSSIAVPWLPAYSPRGAPYQRLAIVLFRQPGPMDAAATAAALAAVPRDGFQLRHFRYEHLLLPFGFTMFRTLWDDDTADVMARCHAPGADLQFKHRRPESLRTPRKPRGWEARRQGPKWRHVWKYTKRIKGMSNPRRWTRV